MAEQVKTTTTTPDVIERAKGFWAANSKYIIIAGSVVILLLAGFLGYKYLYKIPREQKASDQIFPAEKLFAKMATIGSYNKDSVAIVLNGGNLEGVAITGMLKIISNFSGTKAANRAHYIAGACYLNVKDFDKAIKHLKDFDGNGADQVQSKKPVDPRQELSPRESAGEPAKERNQEQHHHEHIDKKFIQLFATNLHGHLVAYRAHHIVGGD